MNGYIAFTDEFLAKEIVQWQVVVSGCFEYFDGDSLSDNASMGKVKRYAVSLKDNCSDHMTGLAAATFGLFSTISNYFQSHSF